MVDIEKLPEHIRKLVYKPDPEKDQDFEIKREGTETRTSEPVQIEVETP